MSPKVLHLSTYDANGGAARAAYALHRAMLAQGIPSRMHVARKGTDDPTVTQGSLTRHRIASQLDRRLWDLQRSPVKTWRSPARFSSVTAAEINRSSADVVNLHWVTDGFLSIEEIAKIEKPLVWSMYDLWPFTGTEHYGADTPDARWRTGYTTHNRPVDESGLDIDRWTYERKERLWGQRPPIHMVPASSWLESATKASSLLVQWPIHRIPHVVDTGAFSPLDASEARTLLGVPDAATIVFLASAGIDDDRKGWDLAERALSRVRREFTSLQVIVVGPVPDQDRARRAEMSAGVPIHWHGTARNSAELRLLYAAGDATVVPSREDNMPLTAMEAQTCGRPVVGFRIGGLPDIVENGVTGILATPFDEQEFAAGLSTILGSRGATLALGRAARQRALSTWSSEVVAGQYLEVYRSALGWS